MFRIVLSVLFSIFLFLIVRGYHNPAAATAYAAMWNVGIVGLAALLYSALNSFDALRHALGQSTRVLYTGLLFSFLPLLVAVYSIAVWQYSPTKLSTFQIISMLFGGLAALADILLFTWLSFGHIRGGRSR